jgi:heme/copper-type cytochrome/quinol oxidase subunit 2
MSNQMRLGVLVGAIVVVVLAFVLLSSGGDDTSGPATTTAATTTPAGEPRARTAPAFETIRVRGGKPVGGVQTITVRKGELARIEVTSPDTSDEIHLHGYDLKRDLKAGGRVRFSFTANAEGIFEMELESASTQIGKLVVEP